MIVLWLILAAVVVLAAVVLVRTARFTPGTAPAVPEGEETIDRDKAVENLRTLIRCRTVSNTNHALEDDAEFEKLINTLPTLYPNVFKTCKVERLADRGLLFTWSGKEHTEPTVLMAHYDVVDVDEAGWKKPPFEGVLEDGVLWGRGALDTKVTFNGVLTAADKLIGEGYTPAQDIYFAFSGGEEVNGLGAVHIVDWFEANHITPALVVDEGGAVVEDVFPGVKQPCALIGIAEKGMMNLEYSVSSAGGHASAPKPHTPVGVLADACCKVENHPFTMHITAPAAKMFDTLGRHSTFLYRMIFANLWLFGGILDNLCKKQGGELLFLRKIVAGAADDSYGIEVAKLAGVPDAIITKAKTYLRELESGATELAAPAHAAQDAAQMTLGDAAGDEIAEQLRSIDLNTITPLEAMRLLFELQQKARG